MAYRKLNVIWIKEVLRLWQRGRSKRVIASRTGLDRKTVQRYLKAARTLGLSREASSVALDDELLERVRATVRPGGARSAGTMREHCRAHQSLIEQWIGEGCRNPKIVRLLGRHTGVMVPLRTLQRFVLEELDPSSRGAVTVRVVDPPPGVLEVDFLTLGWIEERGSGRRRKLHALLCTAGLSRHQFLWPCLRQTLDELIAGLEAAWSFFGGVFPVVILDNLKAAIDQADPLAPKLNPRFLEYVQSRGFEVDATRVRKPRDKARVERQVRYARDDFFGGEHFGSVEEARQRAAPWSRDVAGQRIHGQTRQRPALAFVQQDLPQLLPVPEQPYDPPRWLDVRLGRDGAVSVAGALYSVPHTVAPGVLRVRLERTTVKLYRDGVLVKQHPRQPAGQAQIDAADLPPGKAELATRDGASLQRQASAAGEAVGEYARRLLETRLPWTQMRHVYRLLGLIKRYGARAVEEACRRALALDVVDVVRIDRMLARELVERALPDAPQGGPAAGGGGVVIELRFARDPQEWCPTRQSNDTEEQPDAPA